MAVKHLPVIICLVFATLVSAQYPGFFSRGFGNQWGNQNVNVNFRRFQQNYRNNWNPNPMFQQNRNPVYQIQRYQQIQPFQSPVPTIPRMSSATGFSSQQPFQSPVPTIPRMSSATGFSSQQRENTHNHQLDNNQQKPQNATSKPNTLTPSREANRQPYVDVNNVNNVNNMQSRGNVNNINNMQPRGRQFQHQRHSLNMGTMQGARRGRLDQNQQPFQGQQGQVNWATMQDYPAIGNGPIMGGAGIDEAHANGIDQYGRGAEPPPGEDPYAYPRNTLTPPGQNAYQNML